MGSSAHPGRPSKSEHDRLWRAQWRALRSWIDAEQLMEEHASEPSVLDGWTVRELVAHCARSFLTAVTATASEGIPRTLRVYVTGYADSADEIQEEARALAAELDGELLDWVDRAAESAFAAITSLTTTVVMGPRGPIAREDFIVTRILELVVHGDDLARSTSVARGSPLVDEAITVVAQALADAYEDLTGDQPRFDNEIDWIRAATRRTTVADHFLPLL